MHSWYRQWRKPHSTRKIEAKWASRLPQGRKMCKTVLLHISKTRHSIWMKHISRCRYWKTQYFLYWVFHQSRTQFSPIPEKVESRALISINYCGSPCSLNGTELPDHNARMRYIMKIFSLTKPCIIVLFISSLWKIPHVAPLDQSYEVTWSVE